MVMFFHVQQELDCINSSGDILGKIRFVPAKGEYQFFPDSESVVLTDEEQASISQRLAALASGEYEIPMQDDD